MSNMVEPQITETKPFSWTKPENWTGGINPNGMYNNSSTPVLCKDGTTKNQLSSPNAKYADACINNGGRAENQKPIQPSDKVPLSVSNPTLVANMKLEEEKKSAEMKKKALIETLAKASIVPIGLYAFSKYNKYDTKKTLKVTIIGSVVILGAVVLNGFSGAWSGTTFFDRLIGKRNKPLESAIVPKEA